VEARSVIPGGGEGKDGGNGGKRLGTEGGKKVKHPCGTRRKSSGERSPPAGETRDGGGEKRRREKEQKQSTTSLKLPGVGRGGILVCGENARSKCRR